MTVHVLGISAFYHDSAAAIVRDAEILAAAQEERFSRLKHDRRFPKAAINYCLEEAFLLPAELDAVVFYDNPSLTFDRIVQNALVASPDGCEQWNIALRNILSEKAQVQQFLQETLGVEMPILATDHHLAHAASAFYPSPFEEAAILTIDGVGEWATCSIGRGWGNDIELLEEIRYPHSLGLLYSAFTSFCGFKVNSGEYKLMGLAPYGTPVYAGRIREHLLDVRDDGSFRLNMEYFAYLSDGSLTNDAFHQLFGGAPRQPESRITRREMDLAASIQLVLEEAVARIAVHVRDIVGSENLVMAGGVALNCVSNGKLLKHAIFDRIWFQPAAGDAGGALGAALLVAHQRFGVKRVVDASGRDSQKGSYLGPRFGDGEIRAFLNRSDLPSEEIVDPEKRAQVVAQAIADGQVVGLFNGRMEFGPRALGARSILGDSRRLDTQSVMNLKVKFRESFRPFAPAVLREKASEVFDLNVESPYMMVVAPVREEFCRPVDWDAFLRDEDMLTVVNQARSQWPAITHVDHSARIQTVGPEDHPEFYAILRAFYDLTGCAVVVNTSFNVRGEPIVCSPADAYRCFMRTEIDLLVMESYVLRKSEQPPLKDDSDWRVEYELD